MYKTNDNNWTFVKIEQSGKGTNFVESTELYVNNLTKVYEEYVILDRPNDRDVNYDLKKGNDYIINKDIPHITVGLGWDPSS